MEKEIANIRNGRIPWSKIKKRHRFKIEKWDMRINFILTKKIDKRKYTHYIVLTNFGRVTPGSTMEDVKKILEIKGYKIRGSDVIDLNLLDKNTRRTASKSRNRLYQIIREMRGKNLTGFNSSSKEKKRKRAAV